MGQINGQPGDTQVLVRSCHRAALCPFGAANRAALTATVVSSDEKLRTTSVLMAFVETNIVVWCTYTLS